MEGRRRFGIATKEEIIVKYQRQKQRRSSRSRIRDILDHSPNTNFLLREDRVTSNLFNVS